MVHVGLVHRMVRMRWVQGMHMGLVQGVQWGEVQMMHVGLVQGMQQGMV